MRTSKEAKKLLCVSILLFSAIVLRCEEKSFPLDLTVAYPPVFCEGNVFLFSGNGRNQTLDPSDDAPSCNLIPVTPAAAPVCVNGRVYIADVSGALFEMTERIPDEIARLEGKTLGIFTLDGNPAVVQENKITVPGSASVPLPFPALSAFQAAEGLLVFGEKEGLVYSGGKITLAFGFAEGPVTAACLAGDRIAVGTDKAIFLLDRKNGKIRKRFATRSEIVSVIADGDRIAAASKDHMVRLLDPAGRVLWQTRMGGRPLGLWLHKKGFLTAAAGGRKIVLMERSKGTEIWSFTLQAGEILLPPSVSGTKMAFFAFDSRPEPVLYLVDAPQ